MAHQLDKADSNSSANHDSHIDPDDDSYADRDRDWKRNADLDAEHAAISATRAVPTRITGINSRRACATL